MTYNVFSGTLNPTHFTSLPSASKDDAGCTFGGHLQPGSRFFQSVLYPGVRSNPGRDPVKCEIFAQTNNRENYVADYNSEFCEAKKNK